MPHAVNFTAARIFVSAFALGYWTTGFQAEVSATSVLRPLKCSGRYTLDRCGDETAAIDEAVCRKLGCCYSNMTCYHKVVDTGRIVLHHILLIFFVLGMVGVLIGCVFNVWRKKQDEKKSQKEVEAKRKMDKIYARQFQEYDKRKGTASRLPGI